MSSIAEVLGRPIAFHRAFVSLGIGVTGAVMLSQAIYWSRRAGDDGWFYKTQADWEAETGLTRREQETARRRLAAAGILQEERRGVPAKLFFHVDQDALAAALGVQTSMAESANLERTKAPRQYGGKRQSIDSTETTTETTAEKKRVRATPPRPDDVAQQIWSDWLALRKAKRAPVTQTVVDRARCEAGKARMSFADFLAEWCARGSQGLKAEWLTDRVSASRSSSVKNAAAARAIFGSEQEVIDV